MTNILSSVEKGNKIAKSFCLLSGVISLIVIISRGILQLSRYGTQDIYLTGNPQMTFYKMVYRRYTNFAMEHISVNFSKKPSITITTQKIRLETVIPRHADLIYDTYFCIDLPEIYSSSLIINPLIISSLGHNLSLLQLKTATN